MFVSPASPPHKHDPEKHSPARVKQPNCSCVLLATEVLLQCPVKVRAFLGRPREQRYRRVELQIIRVAEDLLERPAPHRVHQLCAFTQTRAKRPGARGRPSPLRGR